MMFNSTSTYYQYIVQITECVSQADEHTIDCFLNFGRHIRESTKSRFRAVSAGHISAYNIKVTMVGRIAMQI